MKRAVAQVNVDDEVDVGLRQILEKDLFAAQDARALSWRSGCRCAPLAMVVVRHLLDAGLRLATRSVGRCSPAHGHAKGFNFSLTTASSMQARESCDGNSHFLRLHWTWVPRSVDHDLCAERWKVGCTVLSKGVELRSAPAQDPTPASDSDNGLTRPVENGLSEHGGKNSSHFLYQQSDLWRFFTPELP